MNYDEVFLLLQEDKLSSFKDPEPQLIAEAIAAYAVNNKVRQDSLSLPLLPSIPFPAITMIGTSPNFYKITVTAELSAAVQQGTYPATCD